MEQESRPPARSKSEYRVRQPALIAQVVSAYRRCAVLGGYLSGKRVNQELGRMLRFPAGRHLLEIRQRPGPIKVSLGGLVEPEIREPVLSGDGRNPVFLETGRRLRPAINVHRAVSISAQVHA